MKPKGPRQKGTRGELELAHALQKLGIPARRVPLSGASHMLKGDVVLWDKTWEVKRRADGFKSLYKWLEKADTVAVRSDRKGWLVVMTLEEWDEWRCLGRP